MWDRYQDERFPRYLSIDGGTATAGLCVFHREDGIMHVDDTYLVDASHRDSRYDYLEHRHDTLTVRLRRMRDYFQDWYHDCPHRLHHVFYENHFINPRRPTSVIPLVRFQQIIVDAMMDQGVDISYIAPQEMKSKIGLDKKLAKMGKDDVHRAIQRLVDKRQIVLPYHLSLSRLSEHEVDAIGIGYVGSLKAFVHSK